MAKLAFTYYPARLVECPNEFWIHKTYIYNIPLYIMESEHKYPGEFFFIYGSLHSTKIAKIETTQETIDDNILIHITTQNHEYIFEVGEDDYSWFAEVKAS